jgi:hypothetical protein
MGSLIHFVFLFSHRNLFNYLRHLHTEGLFLQSYQINLNY